ncbi:MAG: hypothetical protein GEU83_10130 [Pseudonocardiaceae bacterium]|nr:hypothetical protein [Pseudonocardiaceae bacterium]
MHLTFLGKSTQGGGSPTLFATDRDTYVVQGWRVSGQESSVEVPQQLLGYLERNTGLAAAVALTEQGTYIVSGAVVTDADALGQMDIPGHETCVEVGKVREVDADATSAG